MPYEFQSEKFKGPLEKLLELIEAKELSITDVSLAQVTDDFLAYVKTIAAVATPSSRSPEEKRERTNESKASMMRLLADFIVVASRLILLKSKALLPSLPTTDEEEAEMKDLELRLKLFQRLKPAMKAIAGRSRGSEKAFAREYLANLPEHSSLFYPGAIDQKALHAAMAQMFLVLEEFTRKEETISVTMISLEEKMEEVVRRIESMKELRFGDIREASTRAEIIVTFLAILHLARDHAVSLEQEGNFSDIIIRKRNATR